jgi:hypothetical protein
VAKETENAAFLLDAKPGIRVLHSKNNDDSQGSSVKTVRLSTEMHEKVVNTSCIGVEPVIQGQVSQYRLLRPKRSFVDTIDDFCAEAENYR